MLSDGNHHLLETRDNGGWAEVPEVWNPVAVALDWETSRFIYPVSFLIATHSDQHGIPRGLGPSSENTAVSL
jgi:hypothetical protein